MTTSWTVRGSVFAVLLGIGFTRWSQDGSQPQLTDLASQLSHLGSQFLDVSTQKLLELQAKVEELQRQNINDKARILHLEQFTVELERRVSILETVCGSSEIQTQLQGGELSVPVDTAPTAGVSGEISRGRDLSTEVTTGSTAGVTSTILPVGGYTDYGHQFNMVSTFLVSDYCPVLALPLAPPSSRFDCVTTGLSTDPVTLLCGGISGSTASKKCYSLVNRRWVKHSTMALERWSHSMVATQRGVFSFGGFGRQTSSEILRPRSKLWTEGPTIPGGGVYASCAVAINTSIILIAGGVYDKSQVKLYNVITEEWTSWPPLPIGVSDHDCIRTNHGVLLSGGKVNGGVTSQTVLIDIARGNLETVGPLSVARAGHKMVQYRGTILAIGGEDADYRKLTVIEEWVPRTKSWVTKEFSLNETRAYFAVANVPISTSEFCA